MLKNALKALKMYEEIKNEKGIAFVTIQLDRFIYLRQYRWRLSKL